MLVAGAPGTGKTSLGMQFLYNGATKYGEPGLSITFEEFPQRIYRDALSFGWDFPALEEEGKLKVLFTSPEVLQQDIIRDQGLVGEMIAEIGARRVVVDSISHLQDTGQDYRQFREGVYGLVNALKRESLTSLLTREVREMEAVGSGVEEFVADGVIVLSRSYIRNTNMRFIEVLKSRGSAHIPIPSLYSITDHGLVVVPPFQDPLFRYEDAVSTGIDQLDDLLGGGIPYGSFYLIELEGEVNPGIFDLGFARETLEAGDSYLRIAGKSDARSAWQALVKQAGLERPCRRRSRGGRRRCSGRTGPPAVWARTWPPSPPISRRGRTIRRCGCRWISPGSPPPGHRRRRTGNWPIWPPSVGSGRRWSSARCRRTRSRAMRWRNCGRWPMVSCACGRTVTTRSCR